MTECWVYGAGGHGRVLGRQMAADGVMARFIDDRDAVSTELPGRWEGIASSVLSLSTPVIVAVGNNRSRADLSAGLGNPILGWRSSSAQSFSSNVHETAQLLAGCIVNDGAYLPQGVIVNSNAIVEHDVLLKEFSHVATGAVVGAGSCLDERVFVGMNATVLPGIHIGRDVIIGAGAVVTSDVAPGLTMVGVPARILEKKI